MISVYAYHMCSVLFLPVQSLLTCFRSSLTHFVDFVSNNSSSDTKAFLHFIAFSGSPAAVNRPLHALLYYTVGIPFWTTKSQTYKLYGKKHNTMCSSHLITHYCYVHVMERYKEILHIKKKADLVTVKFIMLLTFKQFYRKQILLHFPCCSGWCLSLDA